MLPHTISFWNTWLLFTSHILQEPSHPNKRTQNPEEFLTSNISNRPQLRLFCLPKFLVADIPLTQYLSRCTINAVWPAGRHLTVDAAFSIHLMHVFDYSRHLSPKRLSDIFCLVIISSTIYSYIQKKYNKLPKYYYLAFKTQGQRPFLFPLTFSIDTLILL